MHSVKLSCGQAKSETRSLSLSHVSSHSRFTPSWPWASRKEGDFKAVYILLMCVCECERETKRQNASEYFTQPPSTLCRGLLAQLQMMKGGEKGGSVKDHSKTESKRALDNKVEKKKRF